MFRPIILLLFFVFLKITSFSQDKDVQSLFNQATKSLKLFVLKKPLNTARIDISDSTFYGEYLMHSCGQTLDNKIFLEIINNSKPADTTEWNDDELQNSILIKDSIAPVDLNYVLKKFGTTKKQISMMKSAVKWFNKHTNERRYYSMSLPIFDNAHQYAVVNISNNYYGGMLLMFKKVDHVWKELGMIDVWRW